MDRRGFRIATFNVESLGGFDDPAGPALAPERRAALQPVFVAMRADIVCLQEVNAQHPRTGAPRVPLALDALLAGTPYARYARAITERPGKKAPADVHNLVVLSRFPIRKVAQIDQVFVEAPRWKPRSAAGAETTVRFDRPLLHVTIDTPGRPLHVIDVHLRAPRAAPIPGHKLDALRWRTTEGWAEGAFLAVMKSAAQALEARLLVDSLFDAEPDAAIAVCGDFNCETREMPTRIIAAAEDETANPDLRARALVPLERALPPDRRHTVLHDGARLMLDHMLVSRVVAQGLVGVEVVGEGLIDEARAEPPIAGSTHAPFVAEIDLTAFSTATATP